MAYVVERPIISDMVRPMWLGLPNGKGHAFRLESETSDKIDAAYRSGKAFKIEEAMAPIRGAGKIKAECGRSIRADELGKRSTGRCKACSAMFPAEIKYGKGLTEPQTEIVHTGSQQGAPREAEAKVAAQVAKIGKGEAPVPTAERSHAKRLGKVAVGQRGEARIDGVALVQGRSMPPVQPVRINPKTGEREVSSRGTMAGPIGPERMDETLRDPKDPGRRKKSQRRNWQRKQANARLREELAALRAQS